MEQLATILGIVGVGLVVLAYFGLQTGRLLNGLRYSLLNLIGAGLILISLIYEWNLPSFIIESIWVMISAYGVWNAKNRNL